MQLKTMEDWNNGMLEYWVWRQQFFQLIIPLSHYSIIAPFHFFPLFHYS